MADAQRGTYSPNGAYPQELPDRWKFEDGTIRTDLQTLSDDDLASLGWLPAPMPPTPGTSYYTHSYEWNSETVSFDATELDEFEKRRRVDYRRFWNVLIGTAAYSSIKEEASQSLLANTLATEFIALISDAKNGDANVEKIQESLNQILLNIPFSDAELAEIQGIFEDSGMFAVYTLA
jgi:hypothetical protein